MDFFEKPFTFDRVVRLLIGISLFLGSIWLINYLSDVLLPFFVALILAYIMNPFVNWLQRFVKSRIAAVLISLGIILLFIIGFLAIMIPTFNHEIKTVGQMLDKLVSKSEVQQQIATYLPPKLSKDIVRFMNNKNWQQLFSSEEVNKYIKILWRKITPHLSSIFSGTISVIFWIVNFFIMILYLIFMLKDYNTVLEEWENLIPPKYRKSILEFLSNFERAMNTYFRAQAAVASIVGILFAIGFTIIGLPMGIVLGLFIGLLDMVPYLHDFGLIPATFLAIIKSLETGQNLWISIGLVLIVFAVVQAISDSILTPKIMGDATGLNPVIILLSLSIWGKIMGLLGLLLAIPLTNLILSYYQTFISKQNKNEGPEQLPASIPLPQSKPVRKIPL